MLVLINTGDEEKTRKTIQGMINSGDIKKPSNINNLKTLIRDFMNKHEAIQDLFDVDTGLILQRHDSDICEDILSQFYNQDIPVLGVHDSFIIGSKYAQKLRSAMKEAFYNKFKVICEITQKGRKK